MALIKKTLIYTALLLVGYSLYAAVVQPERYVIQHQWQENLIKTEKYIYAGNADKVIVGSSLSGIEAMNNLKGYYNLGLAGQGIFDGLKIISKQQQFPEKVYIEMNKILKPEDRAFTWSVTNPLSYYLGKYNPAFRNGKQPLAIVGGKLLVAIYTLKKKVKAASVQPRVNTGPAPNVQKGWSKESLVIFDKLLNQQLESGIKTPDSTALALAFDNLAYYVDLLEKKHVEIIFFEMPVNQRLCDLPTPNAIRKGFYKRFPPNRYQYIRQPDCKSYHTEDGIHLTEDEGAVYTRYFLASQNSKKD